MNQSERVKAALEAADMTAADIAARCDISPQAVYKWLKDPTMNIRPVHLFILADATGHSARWIATGGGSPTPLTSSAPNTAVMETTITAYQARPDTVANQLISGIHAMLRVAGLPVTCLGHNQTIREAIMSGKSPRTFSKSHIKLAVVELVNDLRGKIQHLSGEEIAELLTDKLENWIEAPSTPTSPKTKNDMQ